MTDYERTASAIRQANPWAEGATAAEGEWSAAELLTQIEHRSVTVKTIEPETTTQATVPKRNRGWLLAAAVAALVVLIGAVVIGLQGTGGSDVVEPTPTTLSAPTADEVTVWAAMVDYLDAANAGDADAATAPFAVSEGNDLIGYDFLGETSYIFQRNTAEYLAALDWTFGRADACYEVSQVDVAEQQCGLTVSSPVHEALGIEVGTLDRDVPETDQFVLAHDGESPLRVLLFVDREVRIAYTNWANTNDAAGFADNCDPGLDGNFDEPYAATNSGWIHTAQCAEYLNSITDAVAASITE